MSTDINEAIARWMNEPTEEYECPMCYRVYEMPTECHGLPSRALKCGPRYTYSLDMQVPVWEALNAKDCLMYFEGPEIGGSRWTVTVSTAEWDVENVSDSPAEAAANAIHAALVAMGEVEG